MIRKLIIIGGLLLLIVIVFFGWATIRIIYPTWTAVEKEIIFTVKKGEGIREVGKKLTEENIISEKYLFIGYVVLADKKNNIQAGTYKLNSKMSIRDIATEFFTGNVVFDTITIIEGWTLREIAIYLESKGIGSQDDIFTITGISLPQATLLEIQPLSANKSFVDNFSILENLPEGESLEGYLFPDTYRISTESKAEDVMTIMIKNLEAKIENENIAQKIKESDVSFHQILTMASLIEKEVISNEDKRMVSDILWRRIEIGMPLQVDATVNYVTGRRDTGVTIAETRIDSSYNTYQNKGLPKGPISNPGIESINAAIDREKNNYWYYLSDPKTGATIFSRTHNEHIQAKNKYLR